MRDETEDLTERESGEINPLMTEYMGGAFLEGVKGKA